MKLKNNALQELYDELVDCAISISPYVESPVEKAFRECDEKLSGSATFEHIKKLENDIDILKRDNEDLLFANSEVVSYKHKLEKDIKGLHKQIQALKEFNSEITSKNVDIAGRNVELSRKNELLEATLQETKATLEKTNADRTELQKDRDSYHDLYTELSKTYDKLSEENRKLKAKTDCFRIEVEWYRKHYKEQSDKIRELKSTLNSIYGVRSYDQGQTDLWVALQNVNDSQPFELATCFPDVTGMEDVLNWDLEDFLDAYKKWWEEKEKDRLDHMRDYLARFCEGRLCKGCPLESNEFKCGDGYSFRRRDQFDTRIIPDEELERYYNKAWHGDGQCTLNDGKLFIHDLSRPMERVNRGITKACEQFCKAVRDVDIKTQENIYRNSWECTIEATVEVDKDLLEKVCGVTPEKEEHKLEYGDAVRVPWRNYDYMYIGPEEKHIRLFNPKNHTVVCVSPNDKLTYQGCKVVICDEDDLRKIWNHMK